MDLIDEKRLCLKIYILRQLDLNIYYFCLVFRWKYVIFIIQKIREQASADIVQVTFHFLFTVTRHDTIDRWCRGNYADM